MKKIFLVILVLFAVLSCEKRMNYIPDENVNVSAVTKSLVPIVTSTSNPDLIDNWENITSIKLNGGGVSDAPWIYLPGNSMNIPDYFRFDIKKEDSWKMVYHTLTDVESTEPNYIIFYNDKTGILKVFYYSRAYENNQGLYWVLEADRPTYLIQSNTITQNYQKNKFITTSNVIDHNSISELGHLNPGWNAFYFELPYCYEDNTDLKMSIYAYNVEVSDIYLIGNFTGNLNIPKELLEEEPTTSSISFFTKAASSILMAYSSISSFIGVTVKRLTEISSGLSNTSQFFKGISTRLGKTGTINIQGAINGKVNLIGQDTIVKSGLVMSINNIPFNNPEFGLWNMRKPTLYSSNYYIVKLPIQNNDPYCDVYHKLSFDRNDDSGFMFPEQPATTLESYIDINPNIEDQIQSYRVVDASIFFQNGTILPYNSTYDGGENAIFSTDYKYLEDCFVSKNYVNGHVNMYSRSNSENRINYEALYEFYDRKYIEDFIYFKTSLRNSLNNGNFMVVNRGYSLIDEAMMNIVVEFVYKDGTSFISSRNYPVNIEYSNNSNKEVLENELAMYGLLLNYDFYPNLTIEDFIETPYYYWPQ